MQNHPNGAPHRINITNTCRRLYYVRAAEHRRVLSIAVAPDRLALFFGEKSQGGKLPSISERHEDFPMIGRCPPRRLKRVT